MFFKTGDKVWAMLPSGRYADTVIEYNGSCVVGTCDLHPETRVYWLQDLGLLCGSMLIPRDDSDDKTDRIPEVQSVLQDQTNTEHS
jgi:hypothetical protein